MTTDRTRRAFEGPEPTTVLEILRFRTALTPDQLAYVFVADRDEKNIEWTYADLDRRARAIATALVERRASGKPVLLLYPQGLEYIAAFFGCLYAGAIAVPAYPPDPNRLGRTLPRLTAIIADAGATFALTTAVISQMIHAAGDAAPMLARMQWIASDELPSGLEDAWREPPPRPDTLAFLQYTSGSTSTPKGVMVSHANLVHNIRATYHQLGHHLPSRVVSWLPAYHDMGLIGGILQPLYGGFPGHVMAPITFLKRPFRWLETISKTKATTSVAPNFAYELCVRKITLEERATLDLSNWRLAITGAEPVRASTLDAFGEYFAPTGFRKNAFFPCYGLAEGTLMITGVEAQADYISADVSASALEQHRVKDAGPEDVTPDGVKRSVVLVSAGHPTVDNHVVIVDPETCRPCAPDQVGEIWVHGPSVARGYWRRREDTERTFGGRLVPDDGRRYLRTGDLGFFRGRDIFIAGRAKDLLIIRGRNVHPQDVELTVQKIGRQLRAGAGAAFSIEVGGREEVVIAQELEPRNQGVAEELLAKIRRAVADEHELTPHAVLLLKAGNIPKTTSGKIQRHAAKKEMLALELDVVAASVTVDSDVEPTSLGRSALAFGQLPAKEKRAAAEAWLAEHLPSMKGRASGATFADLGATYFDLHRFIGEAWQRFGVSIAAGKILVKPTIDAFLDAIAPAPKEDELSTAPAAAAARPATAPPAAPVRPAPSPPSVKPAAPANGRSREEIRGWLVSRIAGTLGLSEASIDTTRPFQELGLDSGHAVTLADGLSVFLGRRVPQTLVWDHPTIEAAAQALGSGSASAQRVAHSADVSKIADDAIAVVGMGCRFPGAANLNSFWRLLRDGRDAVGEVPHTRWDIEALYDPNPAVPGKIVSRWGAFLDDIAGFDAAFFSVSLREAIRIDPQQRLLLEVAWEALENAAEPVDRLAGSETGVFVGISSQDYAAAQFAELGTIDAHTCTGNALSIAANRISYVFDLRGPSLAIDTACSGSLVAIHAARESLLRGECSRALVAGVNLIITPNLSIAFSQAKMLSPDGRCKTFDDRADGYVRGEGCGVVVLKRLADAVAAGDRILAVLAGTAINHDGRSNGLTAPNGGAQRAVIRRALERSHVEAHEVGYIEAHGTGTSLGDPIEFEALSEVYGRRRADELPCFVGSVKTNIGHLEAAAGIAGFIKATLAIMHGQVPAHLHLKKPNERMQWRESGLKIPGELTPWPSPRIAGVSSFGFGGANAHVVLREAPPEPPRTAPAPPASVVCIAARTPTARDELARRYAQHLQANPDQDLRDVGYTSCAGRAALPHRVAAVADKTEQMQRLLRGDADAMVRGEVFKAEATRGGAPRVAFLMTGQGAQYPGMGRALFETHPLVRETLTRCDEVLTPLMGRSLLKVLFGDDGEALKQTRFQQPAMFALEVAIGRVLMSWGIRPDAMLGHSIGEYAAACLSDVFELGDGLRLVAERARLMDAQPRNGGMLACLDQPAKVDEIVRRAAARGMAVGIGVRNSPRNIVVSGETSALTAIAAELEAAGIPTRRLNVSHAFHSPMMEGALDAFEAAASTARFAPPRIPIVSNLSGDIHFDDVAPDARYWRRQLRETVRFEAGVRTLLARRCDTFIEVGPGATLINITRTIVGGETSEVALMPCITQGKDEWKGLLAVAARLFVHGTEIDWDAVYAPFEARRVALPTYPFERQRVWFEREETAAPAAPLRNGAASRLQAPDESIRSTPAEARSGAAPDPTSLEGVLALMRQQTMALQSLARAAGNGDVAAALDQQLQVVSGSVRAAPPADPTEAVLRHVSAVSGFARAQISPRARLGGDLGFDSLMKTELDRRLVREFPSLGAGERRALPEDPTVDDIVALIRSTMPAVPEPVVERVERVHVEPPRTSHEVNGHVGVNGAPPSAHFVRQSTLAFEQWDEYRALQDRVVAANAAGANPYGRIHESRNSGRATMEGREVINFSAFNYVGLSNDPRVCEEAKRAIDRYGTSTSATPLLFGETPLHHELEAEVASFLGTEAAIVFASGHATNVATIGHMFGPQDLIVHDQLIHDSAVRGSMLAGARRRPFKHNDWRDLDRILGAMRDQHRRALIVLEGVYSQDGDIADLPRFIELRNKYDAMLMIDEAHSIGVLGRSGRGIGEHFDVDRSQVDLWMGTLSKAIGSCGGYIAARRPIIEYLKFTTPLFIFSTGISPANAGAALGALRVLKDQPHRPAHVRAMAQKFMDMAHARGLNTGIAGGSTIVPIIVGDWGKTMAISNALLGRGINVMPIGAPAVDKNACRLRFFLNYDHTEEDMRKTIDALSEEMQRAGVVSASSGDRGGNGGGPQTLGGGSGPRTSGGGNATILVTGATGFIGNHLVSTLAARGERVRVLVRSTSQRELLPSNVEVVEGALEDLESVRAAVRGVRHIYNCAGLSADWGDWERFHGANVKGVEHLLAAAEEHGSIERFVHLSTSDVYGYPEHACDEAGELRDVGLPYNRSKISGEQLVWDAHARSGLPVTIFRPVTVYGPRSKDWVIEIANLILKGQMLLINGGKAGAGLLFVENAVEGILAAAASPNAIGQAYNLRDGTPHTWKQYGDALAEGLGAPPPKMSIPASVALGVARTSEAVYGGFRVRSRPLLTRHAVYLLSRDQSYPIEKARRDFGFAPKLSFEQGIERTLSWLGTAEGRAAVPRPS